jgi:Putative transposase/Group II intron, maturase-specific domain
MFARYLKPIANVDWVVYAKRPFGGPHQVLNYLGRYTHRVAIANNRLLPCDNAQVRFQWKDYRADNKSKVMTLDAHEFIRRFLQSMRTAIRELDLRCQTRLSMAEIARQINPLLRGWIGYYGRYSRSALYPLIRYVNLTLLAWAMRKFKRFRAHKVRAGRFLERLARENAALFVHWRLGMTGVFT